MSGGGEQGGGRKRRRWRGLLALAVFLGGGGGAGAYFKVWDRYAPPWLQSAVGYGALSSPGRLERETAAASGGAAADRVRAAALGQVVRWKVKVVEVRRPILSGYPTVIGREGETLVRINFPDSLDGEVKALAPGTEVLVEGRLVSVPPAEIVVDDAFFPR